MPESNLVVKYLYGDSYSVNGELLHELQLDPRTYPQDVRLPSCDGVKTKEKENAQKQAAVR